jgi:hypothetical protein
VDVDAVLRLVASRRAELRSEAIELARRIYAESPKVHSLRVGSYLTAARQERVG